MTTQRGSGEAPLYIGVDLGGTTISAGLVDAAGRTFEERRVETESEDARHLLGQLVAMVRELQSHPAAEGRVAAVGVGLPGLVNIETRQVVVLPNLPDLSSVDVYGELRGITDLPVVFDNDANAAAYGELLCGAGRGARHLLYVHLGTGVGSGLVFDGKVWRGANGYAGELGHVTINPEDGIECACGNVGCLETVASAPNIARRARERLYRDRTSSLSRLAIPRDRELTGEDIARAAASGDEMAQVIMDRTGMFLGIALAGAINLLNVEVVVIGGDVMAAGDRLLKPIIQHTRRRAFPPAFDSCRIVASELGDYAGVVGAALLARDGA
jgi:glucokinase